jgi:trypsin-like peptidase
MPGAGFFVAPRKILTCVHVAGVSEALTLWWERDGQPPLEVRVIDRAATLTGKGRPIPALDEDYPDIAVLTINDIGDHPCVAIESEWPSPGDKLQAFGYPREGGAVQLTPAQLTYRGTHGTMPTAYLDLGSDTIKPGMSGAAVLNLRTQAVCGVVVASKHPTRPDGALAVPWSAIVEDLSEVVAANASFHATDRRWHDAATAQSATSSEYGHQVASLTQIPAAATDTLKVIQTIR